MPEPVPEPYRILFECIEEFKRSRRFDKHVADRVNLLVSVSRTESVSMDAIRRNTRSEFNARVAARFLGGLK